MMQSFVDLLCVSLFLSAAITSTPAQVAPTVTIAQGEVVGVRAVDGAYNVFYGIPYAGSVSGQNRFKITNDKKKSSTLNIVKNYAGRLRIKLKNNFPINKCLRIKFSPYKETSQRDPRVSRFNPCIRRHFGYRDRIRKQEWGRDRSRERDRLTSRTRPGLGPRTGERSGSRAPPPPVFDETFMATDPSIECAQPTAAGVRGVENCLVLDIHTKLTSASSPVIVWVHGGHYTTGSKQGISFQNIVKEDIVVVALNYRLSIFGFLCLRVPDAPGNAGLHDVVTGLQWIKENIAAFGGDPQNIVLLGHGSGAAMVDLITLQPQTNDLVDKAIAQSGSSLSPWAIVYEPIERAVQFGERLGYTNKSVEDLATDFINTDLDVIVGNLNGYKFTDNSVLFAPCLEDPTLASIDTFMWRAPIHILRSGNYKKIPFLVGYTSAEGSLRAKEAVENDWLNRMEKNFEQFLQSDLAFTNETIREEVANSIKSHYFPQSVVDDTTTTEYIKYHGDTMFLVSVIRAARERAVYSANLVRLYEFDFMGTFGEPWPYPKIALEGARHGHELHYLFIAANHSGAFGDLSVSLSITRRWILFAHTGIPVATEGSGSWPWSPVTTSTIHCLVYRDTSPDALGYMEISDRNPHFSDTSFWFNIYANFYRDPDGLEISPEPEPEESEPEIDVDTDNAAPVLLSSMTAIRSCYIATDIYLNVRTSPQECIPIPMYRYKRVSQHHEVARGLNSNVSRPPQCGPANHLPCIGWFDDWAVLWDFGSAELYKALKERLERVILKWIELYLGEPTPAGVGPALRYLEDSGLSDDSFTLLAFSSAAHGSLIFSTTWLQLGATALSGF
ncbi:Bile salt-activated lipase [Eumeta japonica]|uniref:Bile salt-activated lipase n=1 Tax=Eumeta variegata TaxID=151549 RepID=A0A4C1YEV4_EUMVA|nr:Bile salt-activated lipase [Eumeta japonica]